MRGRPTWQTERRPVPQPREGNDPYENNRPRNGPFARFEQAGKWSGNHRVSASARNNNHNRNSNNNNQDNESDDDELPGAYAVSRVNPGNQHSVVDDAWDPTDHIQNADVIVDPGPVTAYEEFGDEGNTSGFINTEEASVSIADDAHSVVTSPKRNDRSTRLTSLILLLFAFVVVCLIGGIVAFSISSKTTPVDKSSAPDKDDCMADNDPFLQCECSGQVRQTDTTVMDIYKALRASQLVADFVSANATIESCAPDNVALVWLAIEMAETEKSGQAFVDQKIQDRLVMALTFATLGGQSWTRSENWMTDTTVCMWYGVQCDVDGHISSLVLPDNKLQGTLDSRIGLLQDLSSLDLSRNEINGTIPLQLWSLPSLEELLLCQNELAGTLPQMIQGGTALKRISLCTNTLTGSLPTFSPFENLVHLDVSNTHVSGTLPDDINRLSKLETINVSIIRDLKGPLPSTISLMSNLRSIDITMTLISGSVSGIQDVFPPSMEELWLSNSFLDGSISTNICHLSNLQILDLDQAILEGTLPSELGLCSQLRMLSVGNSNLGGSLPTELGNLQALQVLNVDQNNRISGTVPAEFVKLSNLELLSIFGTAMSASIPSGICNIGPQTHVVMNFPPESCPCCQIFLGR